MVGIACCPSFIQRSQWHSRDYVSCGDWYIITPWLTCKANQIGILLCDSRSYKQFCQLTFKCDPFNQVTQYNTSKMDAVIALPIFISIDSSVSFMNHPVENVTGLCQSQQDCNNISFTMNLVWHQNFIMLDLIWYIRVLNQKICAKLHKVKVHSNKTFFYTEVYVFSIFCATVLHNHT